MNLQNIRHEETENPSPVPEPRWFDPGASPKTGAGRTSLWLPGRAELLICLAIIMAVLLIYWPVQDFAFIDYDDNLYVYENLALQNNKGMQFLRWAFVDIHTGHWHPLTWLSHKLDWVLFQERAGGHHWTNVILHIANALLLFFLLRASTGKRGRSALAAFLFAVHPLNVESVAWIAERKNVLSTFFGLGTLLFYIRYTARPSYGNYLPVLILYVFGLMAKPMLVTLPILMLTWDYWPLGRLMSESMPAVRRRLVFRVIYEKIPLFCLSAVSVLLTVQAARDGGALRSWAEFPLEGRVMNAIQSYVQYLIKWAYPADLTFFYPYQRTFQLSIVLLSTIVLIGASVLIWRKRKGHPYGVTGWLWYLIALLPVIGLVQVGHQAMADRYAYMPLIGLLLLVCWSIPGGWFHLAAKKRAVVAFALLIVVLFAVVARNHLQYWQSSKTLALHALQVTERNHIAHLMMGNALLQDDGDSAGAAFHYGQALAARPDYGAALNNLGNICFDAAHYVEAGRYYRLAVERDPRNMQAQNNLGVILLMQGRREEAASQFQEALRLDPHYRSPRENLLKMGWVTK